MPSLDSFIRELFAKWSCLGSLVKELPLYLTGHKVTAPLYVPFDYSTNPHAVVACSIYRRNDGISQLIIATISIARDSWRQTVRNGVVKRAHNVGNSRLIRGGTGATETGGNERCHKREVRGKYGGPAAGRRHRQDADPAVTFRSIYLGPRTSLVTTPRRPILGGRFCDYAFQPRSRYNHPAVSSTAKYPSALKCLFYEFHAVNLM